jgi:hypothetical protein
VLEGETVTAVPLVTTPTPLLTLPVPPLKTAVRVVEPPALIAGVATTFNVNVCCALGLTPLFAVIVMG